MKQSLYFNWTYINRFRSTNFYWER